MHAPRRLFRARPRERLLAGAAALVCAAGIIAAAGAPARAANGGWQPKTPPLTTPWTDQVSPSNDHPEYPRPQLTRPRWENLNGVWQFAAGNPGDQPPSGTDLPERILVPFPEESALSGIMRHDDYMWYRRTFTVPDSWGIGGSGCTGAASCPRLLLHFGAVDWRAAVYVNGTLVTTHQGGYDSFTADITGALRRGPDGRASGAQELIVGVYDPVENGALHQPIGKQRAHPGGIFYTSSSGIWQTVWMEPVPAAHIDSLQEIPDLAGHALDLTAGTSGVTTETVVATAYDGNKVVGTARGPAGSQLRIPVPDPHLWSPSDPHLYSLDVRLADGPRTVDDVGSYFGMRSAGLATVGGKTRILLNGRYTFMLGTLNQGFWPDGEYTAPTDDALKYDIQQLKALGFNTLREHVKVDADRLYYWADKLGLLVWQDMPAMFPPGQPAAADQAEFETELHAMVAQHISHPSIVMWVPFNEGWGEYDPARIADEVKAWDPSRLVDNNSGFNCCGYDGGNGDVIDNHTYVGPGGPVPSDTRAAVDGEFGGLGLRIPAHQWDPGDGFAYEMEPDPATLTSRYVQLLDKTVQCQLQCGVSAAIYTQTSDVEDEVNGLMTYDRRVLKMDPAQVRAANEAAIAAASQAGSYQPPPPPPGHPGLTGVGYWPFDEGSGTVAHDESGSGHDATLVNGPAWVSGEHGGALQFNGQNQWADTGTSVLDTTGDYTVAAWVKLDHLGSFATAVSQDGDFGESEFFLQYSGADNRFAMSTGTGRALASFVPQTGVWYHLAGVRDSARNLMKLYVDGQLAGTLEYCPGNASHGNLVIGRALYGGNHVDFWPGAIDQVHVYDRALSDQEVQQLYQSGL